MVSWTPSSKPEFPPLLPIGRHSISLSALRDLCVSNFPLSTRRDLLMLGLEKLVSELLNQSIVGELWIDGSFVTQKINPDDVDVVLRIDGVFYEQATDEQRGIIDRLSEDLKADYHCDSYTLMQFPEGHPLYWEGEYQYAYWMRQWGFNREDNTRGIAVLILA